MIRWLYLLVPVTITPLLAVETIETVIIRGPLSQIALTIEEGASGAQAGRSDIVPGLSLLSASASADEGTVSGLGLLHALRF